MRQEEEKSSKTPTVHKTALNPHASSFISRSNVIPSNQPLTCDTMTGAQCEYSYPTLSLYELPYSTSTQSSPDVHGFSTSSLSDLSPPPTCIPTNNTFFSSAPEAHLSQYTGGKYEGVRIDSCSDDSALQSDDNTNDDSQRSVSNSGDESLIARVRKQLEFYFSLDNLSTDQYLQSQMDPDQFVPIWTVANFNAIKNLTTDINIIKDALNTSKEVQLDVTGSKVRPNIKRCTLILRDIPQHTMPNEVEELFNNGHVECPPCVKCTFAHNNCWSVEFRTEHEALQAYDYFREHPHYFHGDLIKVRIKAKPIQRSSPTDQSPNSYYYNNYQSNNNVQGYPVFPPVMFSQWLSPTGVVPIDMTYNQGAGYPNYQHNNPEYDHNRFRVRSADSPRDVNRRRHCRNNSAHNTRRHSNGGDRNYHRHYQDNRRHRRNDSDSSTVSSASSHNIPQKSRQPDLQPAQFPPLPTPSQDPKQTPDSQRASSTWKKFGQNGYSDAERCNRKHKSNSKSQPEGPTTIKRRNNPGAETAGSWRRNSSPKYGRKSSNSWQGNKKQGPRGNKHSEEESGKVRVEDDRPPSPQYPKRPTYSEIAKKSAAAKAAEVEAPSAQCNNHQPPLTNGVSSSPEEPQKRKFSEVASHETVKPVAKPAVNINQFSSGDEKKKGVNSILSKKTPSAFSPLKQTVKVEEPKVVPAFSTTLKADNPWSNSPFRKVEKKVEPIIKSKTVSVVSVKSKLEDLDLNDSTFEEEEKSPQSRTPKAETFNHVEPVVNHVEPVLNHKDYNHTEPIISNHIEEINNYIQPVHNWFDDDSFSDGPPSKHGSISSDYKKSSVTSLKRSSHKEVEPVEVDLVLDVKICDEEVFENHVDQSQNEVQNEVENEVHNDNEVHTDLRHEITCNNEAVHHNENEAVCNNEVACSSEIPNGGVLKAEALKPFSNHTSFDSEFDSDRDEFFSSCSDARED